MGKTTEKVKRCKLQTTRSPLKGAGMNAGFGISSTNLHLKWGRGLVHPPVLTPTLILRRRGGRGSGLTKGVWNERQQAKFLLL